MSNIRQYQKSFVNHSTCCPSSTLRVPPAIVIASCELWIRACAFHSYMMNIYVNLNRDWSTKTRPAPAENGLERWTPALASGRQNGIHLSRPRADLVFEMQLGVEKGEDGRVRRLLHP